MLVGAHIWEQSHILASISFSLHLLSPLCWCLDYKPSGQGTVLSFFLNWFSWMVNCTDFWCVSRHNFNILVIAHKSLDADFLHQPPCMLQWSSGGTKSCPTTVQNVADGDMRWSPFRGALPLWNSFLWSQPSPYTVCFKWQFQSFCFGWPALELAKEKIK